MSEWRCRYSLAVGFNLVDERDCSPWTIAGYGSPMRARSSRASSAKTSFIRFRFHGHSLIPCPQRGEDLLSRCYAAGVSIGDTASKRCIKRREPGLSLVKKAKPFAQYFAL